MNEPASVALVVTVVLALANWLAVAQRNKPLEYVAKPGTLLALTAVAVALDPVDPVRRWAFVVALVFSLMGDIFLMLPGDRFVQGVGAFFLAHIAYIVGLRIGDTSIFGLVLGVAVTGVFVGTIGMRILGGVKEKDPAFLTPVTAYIAVISVMVASAVSTGEPLAIVGAAIFMLSDTLIAWNRFVQPLAWAPVAIMVTYHVGQTSLVLSLTRG